MSQAELPAGENTEDQTEPLASDQFEDKDDRYRRLEREWQNEIGHELLDGPHEDIGSGGASLKVSSTGSLNKLT